MRRLLVLVGLVALLLGGCTEGSPGSTEKPVATNQVTLPKSYQFEPAVIQVQTGTTVTWTNEDDFPHNVHLLDGSDRTEDLPLGKSVSITFDEPGRIDYECSLHPQQMQGTVIVK
jgi:plastocyanin